MPACRQIALTKLDVLSSMKEIPIITGYNDPNGSLVEFDPTDNLDSCTPVIYKVPGWEEDISHCRTFDELPANAKITLKQLRICFMQKSTLYLSVLREMNIY